MTADPLRATSKTIEVDAHIKIDDSWFCPFCGEKNQFTAFAAHNWRANIFHTCACGTEIVFLEGVVLDISHPEPAGTTESA